MIKYNYEELLERAYSKLPKIRFNISERFDPPEPSVTYIKNKTVFLNAKEFVDYIKRDFSHFQKFLQREYGVPVEKDQNRLIIFKKLSESQIKRKTEKYIKEFVLCPVCGKPDTTLVKKERGIIYIKCLACGAESPVRYVI